MANARLVPLFGIAMWILMTSGCMNESKVDMQSSSTVMESKIKSADQPTVEMQEVLYQLAKLGGRPIEKLTASEARKQPTTADAVKALLKSRNQSTRPEPVARVENRSMPSADKTQQLPLRIYWPQGQGPFPLVVYYHGGGFVIGDLD
ncbi:MAG TPA: hypothetical protein VFX01_02060, partial [Methylophilaceae bacterium]|nr:hypothetical protein [Methylophilaceae bacterium]